MRTRLCTGLALLALLAGSVAGAEEMKGKVKTIVYKNKTLSMAVEGKGIVVFKFDDKTRYENASGPRDVHPDDVLQIAFAEAGAENLATSISKVVAKLPEGVSAIGTDELRDLIRSGAPHTLVDSRPKGKYNEGHIPTAVSMPYADLEKADAEGRADKLLPEDKDRPLIFYCAGVT